MTPSGVFIVEGSSFKEAWNELVMQGYLSLPTMKSFIISQVLELDDPPIESNSKEESMRLDMSEKSGRFTATADVNLDTKEVIENIKEVHA